MTMINWPKQNFKKRFGISSSSLFPCRIRSHDSLSCGQFNNKTHRGKERQREKVLYAIPKQISISDIRDFFLSLTLLLFSMPFNPNYNLSFVITNIYDIDINVLKSKNYCSCYKTPIYHFQWKMNRFFPLSIQYFPYRTR